jgi:hypothetical protein
MEIPVFKTPEDQNRLVAPNPCVGKEEEEKGGSGRGKKCMLKIPYRVQQKNDNISNSKNY